MANYRIKTRKTPAGKEVVVLKDGIPIRSFDVIESLGGVEGAQESAQEYVNLKKEEENATTAERIF